MMPSQLCRSRLIAVALFIVIVAGCRGARHREHVEQTLAHVDKTVLLAEASRVWEQYRSNWSEELPPTAWPQVFRKFAPEKVIVDRSGVFVCTHSFFVRDAGLFVALDPSFEPKGKTDPTYEHLEGFFYWYDANG